MAMESQSQRSQKGKQKSKPSSNLRDVSVTAFKMIEDKENYGIFDFDRHLRQHKGKDFESPLDLISDKGHNLLHEIADKGRLSLCIVILVLGWWKPLSDQKVSENSSSEHKGCTPLEIAHRKKTRKPANELSENNDWENNLTSLMKACRNDDIAKVKSILENYSEPQEIYFVDRNGWNALFWAVAKGNKEVVPLLLQAGVESMVKSTKEETLLHIACMFGHSEIIEMLLKDDKCTFDPHKNDLNRKSAYDRVAENGDIESLKVLINCGYQPKPSFLVLAAYNGRWECMEYCLKELKMDIDGMDIYQRTALHRAIENKKEQIVKDLLKLGASLTKATCSNRNILHILAEHGSILMVKDFIDLLKKDNNLVKFINVKDRYNGVDLCFLIRGKDRGREAWHYVEVDRNQVPIFLKRTRSGNVDVAAFGTVIRSGWGVNPDQENLTFIEDMFKERKLNEEADTDMTPLHIAAFKGNTDIAKCLLEHGAKPNEKDKFGLTPMMLACSKGNLELVQALEKAGASFEDETSDGKTCTTIADGNEHDTIVNYIKGRDLNQVTESFVTSKLITCKEDLSNETLEGVRSSGEDVKQHIVNVLRGLRIDINQYLARIGSGPVLQATDQEE